MSPFSPARKHRLVDDTPEGQQGAQEAAKGEVRGTRPAANLTLLLKAARRTGSRELTSACPSPNLFDTAWEIMMQTVLSSFALLSFGDYA